MKYGETRISGSVGLILTSAGLIVLGGTVTAEQQTNAKNMREDLSTNKEVHV
jgi:hypothetical protein